MTEKLIAMLGALLILMAGWLFSLIIEAQQHMRDHQEQTRERVSKIEERIILHTHGK